MKRAFAGIFLALLLVGCAGVGPRAIQRERYDYNEAIVRTRNEQLLLNLVRLRYRDTPFFLELTSVATQYTFSGNVSAGATIDVDGGEGTEKSVGGGVAYVESPTVTYAPLAGEDFAKRLLSPVPRESLMLLTQSGWRIDRVWRCCVQRINGLWNAPSAAGPTPDAAPEYERFREAASLARRLQSAHAIDVAQRNDGRLVVRLDPTADAEASRELKRLLGLRIDANEFDLVPAGGTPGDEAIMIAPRSLIGVLYFLSQAVEPPERDREAGLVTRTLRRDGGEFDWSEVTGDLLTIRSSLEPPEHAFVRVRYRDAWFYIDDADLTSKSTFGLLDQLFGLQAGNTASGGPLLTLPVGR